MSVNCCFEHVTMTAPTNRDSDKFMLRFPDGMRDRLKEEAAKNGRSMNAEIVSRLEESLSHGGNSKIDVDTLVNALEDRFGPLNLGKKP